MKKQLLSILMAVLCCATVISCSGSTLLAYAAESANADCPTDLGDGWTCTAVKYENNSIVYYCSLGTEDSIDDIDDVVTLKAILLESTLTEESKDLVKLVVKENASIVYVYKDRTNRSLSIELTTRDLTK